MVIMSNDVAGVNERYTSQKNGTSFCGKMRR